MSFQSSLEMFQCQFWICNVFRQGVPHSRSGDTVASWPEARRVLVRGVVRCPRAAERRWALAPIFEMGMQDRLRLCRATAME